MENHTLSSTVKNNPASSLSSPSHITNKGMNNTSAPMSQEFLGFSTNEQDCLYSEIYPIIAPQNQDGYFADNDLMDIFMFKDAPLIQQIRSPKYSQKENQDNCDTRKVAIKNGSVESEQLMCEPHSVTTNTKTTLNYDHNYSQVQSSPTPPEVFSHSQQLNLQLSCPIVVEPRRSQENSQDQEHRECNNAQQSGMDINAPISQDHPSSLNSEARVTNELGSPCSQIDFSSSVNEDYDYFAYNAPLIGQIRPQENSQKEHQDYFDTHQVSINNNGSVESEHLMSEPDSVIIDTKKTQTYENDKYSQVQSWPTLEIFGPLSNPTYERFVLKDPIVVQPRRSQESYRKEDPVYSIARQVMINSNGVKSEQFKSEPYSTDTKIRLSRPANKRQKTSSVNQRNYNNIINMAFAPNNNFNVKQGTPTFVKPTTRGCKCRKSSCSNGRCPCFRAEVGCSRETCGCQGCENRHGTNRPLPNKTVKIMNSQRTIFRDQPPQPTDPLQSRPSSCSRVHPTQRASVHELPQPTPLQQFRPSPCSLVNLTQRASINELPQPIPFQYRPSSRVHPTQRASVHELPQPTPLQQFRPSPCSSVNLTQRASVNELPQTTPLQYRPSLCLLVHPTQRASVHELPQPTPLQQFRPSPCSSVNLTQRASVNELPQTTPLQYRPSLCLLVHPTQRASVHELPQPTPLQQFHPSSCSLVHPTQRASVHELPQPTPLQQFRPSPCSLVHPTQRASVHELPQPTLLQQFRPSPCSVDHPTQKASVHELFQQTP